MKNIVVFMNAYSQGISGADKLCIEFWKQTSNKDITFVTSKNGMNLCKKFGLRAKYRITTKENIYKKTVISYILRIVIGIVYGVILPKQDLIYSSSDQLADILPAAAMKLRNYNAKWIVKSYHIIPENRRISYWAQTLSLSIIKLFSATVITASKYMKNILADNYRLSNEIHVIYPGINKEKYKYNEVLTKKYDAFFLSRLHKSKGIFELIEIWKLVVKKRPNAKLIIAGQGDSSVYNLLNKKIIKNNMTSSIQLKGFISNNEINKYINESKIFVFPSHEEGFSLTVAEMLSSGIPVVAYDLAIYSEIFGNAIVKIPSFDVNKFAISINKLLNNKKELHNYSTLGNQVAKKYSKSHAFLQEFKIIK